ncbi:tyrosine-type recombinase/integrase [Chryseobacterium tongliaoense]|uniref:tyrosine-type recombinase/integrase n=1 Tax=Chryseobacterium tongliaoense TaxID=3240933 RepID=UPI00351935EE
MATIRYYLRTKSANSKIQVQFSISRDLKLRTSTDLVINHSDWSSDTNFPKQNNPENKILTRQLRELSNHLLNEYNSNFVAGVIFDTNWLKDKLSAYFNRIDEKVDDSIFLNYLINFIDFKEGISAYTKSTINKLNNLKDRFAAYQKKKKKNYLIEDISGKVLIDFKNYLIVDCGLMETTATRFIKNLKTVLFDSRNNGKQIHHQIAGFTTGTTNSDHKVFLSFKEIEQIKDITTLNTDWNIAKDWLILGCYLGQRSSDLLRMTKRMIYTKTDADGNSFRFIEIKQQKTGEKVVIPLHDEVEIILKKYNNDFPPVFADNPDSNSTLFNKHIKKVCELAGINEMVKGKVFNEETKKNEIVETEKCKLVSSHVCRRSFATNFYGNKMFTTPQLMSITGHKTESMFLNYIGRTADDWAMQTAKTFKELSNQKIS